MSSALVPGLSGTPRHEEDVLTNIIADITMSLDGCVTAPDPDLVHGLASVASPARLGDNQ